MATLASDSPPSTPPFHRRRKSWARRVERICCTTISYFPLSFVYGLSTWAVWVEVTASLMGRSTGLNYFTAALGIILYSLAAVSYTFAVFTSPGSPLDPRQDLSKRDISRQDGPRYEGLPTHEDDGADFRADAPHGPMTTVTAKSTGQKRYCKKCACLKPDRAHHCSTCGRCVLKMDHHCPWLATCVGLRNYKPFLLFLTYISLFCWLSFAVSAGWVWRAIIVESAVDEGLRTVNCIMLAVLSGIIGLTLSGFTAWHIYLAATGSTTIESLEKTRYLTPLRKHLEPQAQGQRHYLADEEAQVGQEQGLLEQLKETHANALPGVLRPEEGEESDSRSVSPNPASNLTHPRAPQAAQGSSPAKASLQRSYASLEEQRERDRYAAYLDEQDSEKLPNAFNLGWRRNLLHVMGNRPLFWFLPICNTSGDGWMWEVSPKWIAARAEVARERQAREREDAVWRQEGADWERRRFRPPPPRDVRWVGGQGFVRQGGESAHGSDGAGALPMQSLDRRRGDLHPPGAAPAASGDGRGLDVYDTSEEEDERAPFRPGVVSTKGQPATSNWNDIPDDFLAPGSGSRNAQSRSHSRGRRKGD